MSKSPRLETSYRVGHGDVHLSIVVGDGQIGGSAVRLDDKLIATGDIKKMRIGNGAEIANRKLVVKTIVSDENDSTNRTSVTYVLAGGPSEEHFKLAAVVDNDGDEITYRATFDLKGGNT